MVYSLLEFGFDFKNCGHSGMSNANDKVHKLISGLSHESNALSFQVQQDYIPLKLHVEATDNPEKFQAANIEEGVVDKMNNLHDAFTIFLLQIQWTVYVPKPFQVH
ncbi:hypothetical protein M5689_011122 [Euphorbia peplus]|nr:hypothetical protein M5689_011122 [Euphorbia peplus]